MVIAFVDAENRVAKCRERRDPVFLYVDSTSTI